MELPGKLSLGILEEDNPQESYFRYKPCLLWENGEYVPCDGEIVCPDEGALRIVPDKNESSHFKIRMRHAGRYCYADLRDHAGDNDKIRMNKNFQPGGSEKNMYIIYSDVIREGDSEMFIEIVSENAESAPSTPVRARVKKDEGEEGGYTFFRVGADGDEQEAALDGDLYVPVTIAGRTLLVLKGDRVGAGSAAAPFVPAWKKRAEVPAEDAAEEAGDRRPEPEKAEGTREEMRPEAVRRENARTENTRTENIRTENARPEPARAERVDAARFEKPDRLDNRAEASGEGEGNRPWISRNPMLAPRVDPRKSPYGAQTGFNPRKGKSLQEIVDDKWRHSRMEQLGQPVPGNAYGRPVESPVDRAVGAVRDAWLSIGARETLIGALSRIDGFGYSFTGAYAEAVPEKLRQDIGELEEMKQTLLKDIEELGKQATGGRPVRPVPEDLPEIREIADKAGAYFASSAQPVTRRTLARLVAAAAVGRVVLLTGKPGNDMNDVAHLLAHSLGLSVARGKEDWEDGTVLILTDANATKEKLDKAIELACGADEGKRLWVVLRDNVSGEALPACVTEKAVLVRMEEPAMDVPFIAYEEPEETQNLTPFLLETAVKKAEMPAAANDRITDYRRKMVRRGCGLSRRVLSDMYCLILALTSLGYDAVNAADTAFVMRALPGFVANLPIRMIGALEEIVKDSERCRAFMNDPIGIL